VIDQKNSKMDNEETKPAIPELIKNWKTRKLRKKQEELEDLRLEIEKAKLEKELKEIRDGK